MQRNMHKVKLFSSSSTDRKPAQLSFYGIENNTEDLIFGVRIGNTFEFWNYSWNNKGRNYKKYGPFTWVMLIMAYIVLVKKKKKITIYHI